MANAEVIRPPKKPTRSDSYKHFIKDLEHTYQVAIAQLVTIYHKLAIVTQQPAPSREEIEAHWRKFFQEWCDQLDWSSWEGYGCDTNTIFEQKTFQLGVFDFQYQILLHEVEMAGGLRFLCRICTAPNDHPGIWVEGAGECTACSSDIAYRAMEELKDDTLVVVANRVIGDHAALIKIETKGWIWPAA